MKNIERVWKAEQKHDAERKKIEELQKQLKEERAREEITKYAEESGAIKLVLPTPCVIQKMFLGFVVVVVLHSIKVRMEILTFLFV